MEFNLKKKKNLKCWLVNLFLKIVVSGVACASWYLSENWQTSFAGDARAVTPEATLGGSLWHPAAASTMSEGEPSGFQQNGPELSTTPKYSLCLQPSVLFGISKSAKYNIFSLLCGGTTENTCFCRRSYISTNRKNLSPPEKSDPLLWQPWMEQGHCRTGVSSPLHQHANVAPFHIKCMNILSKNPCICLSRRRGGSSFLSTDHPGNRRAVGASSKMGHTGYNVSVQSCTLRISARPAIGILLLGSQQTMMEARGAQHSQLLWSPTTSSGKFWLASLFVVETRCCHHLWTVKPLSQPVWWNAALTVAVSMSSIASSVSLSSNSRLTCIATKIMNHTWRFPDPYQVDFVPNLSKCDPSFPKHNRVVFVA